MRPSATRVDVETFKVADLLKSSGERMRRDLHQRLVGHPGEEGSGREETVRQFLRTYLPKRFEVSTGFGFDWTGRRSNQLDLIVADTLLCPRFETSGGIRFYPCESIVAVGQVRSAITSKRKLRHALDNLESAKALDRSANGRAVDQTYREALDSKANYLHQVFTFILITGNSLKGETVREELLSYVENREPHLWPNLILALDNYLITHCCEEGVCPNPMHSRGIALEKADDASMLLMRFYILLGRAIAVTRVSGFPYWEYLNRAQWNAEVVYPAAEQHGILPPQLSTTFEKGR